MGMNFLKYVKRSTDGFHIIKPCISLPRRYHLPDDMGLYI